LFAVIKNLVEKKKLNRFDSQKFKITQNSAHKNKSINRSSSKQKSIKRSLSKHTKSPENTQILKNLKQSSQSKIIPFSEFIKERTQNKG
jgi:hypothetical protein